MAYVNKKIALLLGSPYLFDRVTIPLQSRAKIVETRSLLALSLL
jgi:hypothetical protein